MSTRVLIVEDHKDSLEVLSLQLKSMGYEVIAAFTAEEGIEKAETHIVTLPVAVYMQCPALRRMTIRFYADGRIEEFPNGKLHSFPLEPRDTIILRSGGGGGYGDPRQRPPELVREDVLEGYVSLGRAAEEYGVVLDPETLAVDREATRALREEG